MANSWGESGTTWSQGDWGQQNITTVVLSGLSITSSLGEVLSYPEEGWGRSTWGSDDWGDFSLTVFPTGYSITGSIGELAAASEQGWGRSTWGNEPWGDSNSPVVSVSGFSITGSLGTPYAAAEEGWGRDEWGYGNWGENTTTVILDGLEITALQGPSGWGLAPWDEVIGWGGDLRLETTQLSIAALTGIEATLSLGTVTPNYDFLLDLTGLGPAQMGAGLGVPNINDGADHSQGVGSLLITGSLGSVGHEMAYDLTGIEATLSLGTIDANDTQLIDVTGIEATGYVGSITPDDMAIGVSGYSITGSLGTPIVTDMQVGISGIEMTSALGSAGMSPLYYKDVDITGNTSYTYVKHAGEI
jgi:hypothetical protein